MVRNLRMNRLEEQFKRELGEVLLKKVRDPRIVNVTVMGVEISREFDLAKVFVSVIGDKAAKKDILKVLEGASGYLRTELADVFEIRKIPKLLFRIDETIEHSIRIDGLLSELGFPRELGKVGDASTSPKPIESGAEDIDLDLTEDE